MKAPSPKSATPPKQKDPEVPNTSPLTAAQSLAQAMYYVPEGRMW